MGFLTELWLPIVLSAVCVFIASSIIHMVLPIHKNDMKQLSNEEKVLAAMREQGVVPGEYMFPWCVMKEMESEEMVKKYNLGPVGNVRILPTGPPKIGKGLVQWFILSLFISFMVAYISRQGLSLGAEFMPVFRLTGTVAILGYALSDIPHSIWWGQSWSTTFKFVFDGIVYGLVTGATFAWLWPGAA